MEIKDVKIGMKVIGNDLADIAYLYTKKGWIGTVEAIRGDSIYVGDGIHNGNYRVNPKAFDKYEGEEEVLKVYRVADGYYVEYKGQMVTGSFCHPNDKFNEQFGLNLALRRFCKTLNDRTVVEQKTVTRTILNVNDLVGV